MKLHKELLPLIQKAKDKIKESDTIKKMCEDYSVDVSIIDLVPVAFDENLDVSARTSRGCIYFNYALVDGFIENNLHYFPHELMHFFQQCFGDGPTQGATEDSYLDNEFEQEGFQAQTEFLSETKSDEEAENYIEKVLDHHNVPERDKNKRKKDLLNIATSISPYKKAFNVSSSLLDSIERQVLQVYTSLVWKKLLELIDEGKNNDKALRWFYSKDNKELKSFYRDLKLNVNLKGRIERLDLHENNSIVIRPSHDSDINKILTDNFYIVINKIKDNFCEIEINYPTTEMSLDKFKEIDGKFSDAVVEIDSRSIIIVVAIDKIDGVLEWMSNDILNESYIPYLEEKVDDTKEMSLNGIIDLKEAIQECQKYTSAPADKYFKSVILSVSLIDVLNSLSELGYSPFSSYEKLSFYLSKRGWSKEVKIEVFIDKLVENFNTLGLWHTVEKKMFIAFPKGFEYFDLEDLPKITEMINEEIYNGKNTIRHEVQHMIQDIINTLRSFKYHESFGLPSKKIRNNEVVDIHGIFREDYGKNPEEMRKAPGSLVDIEFYPYLSDAISEFEKKSKNFPIDLKKEYMKVFLGEPNNLFQMITNKMMPNGSEQEKNNYRKEYDKKYQENLFFKILKVNDPIKWEAATKILYKKLDG